MHDLIVTEVLRLRDERHDQRLGFAASGTDEDSLPATYGPDGFLAVVVFLAMDFSRSLAISPNHPSVSHIVAG